MAGKRWGKTEDRYLKRFYPQKGSLHCAEQLGRSKRGTEARASRLGIQSGLPKGYVPLWWVAPRYSDTNNISTAAMRAAKEAGVLRTFEGRLVKHVVPAWWADQYAEEQREMNAMMARTSSWLRTKDIARMTGMTSRSVLENVREGFCFGRHLQHVERVLIDTPRRHLRWHPQQARMAINAWRASRRAA